MKFTTIFFLCVYGACDARVATSSVKTPQTETKSEPNVRNEQGTHYPEPFLSPRAVPSIFYPFGTGQGDRVAPVNDDGSTSSVPISIGFPFFNKTNSALFVNTNGDISFGNPIGSFTPTPFPLGDNMVLIGPYWCDIDTRENNGRVYYRETTDPSLLMRATDDILRTFASQGLYFFKAQWLFIATWHNVTFYGGSATTPVNSFQAVLVTDGTYSFTIFNYDKLTWTTGTASGGDPIYGLGGTPAQVGFNAGDGINYFAVPWSRTPEIVNIGNTTNVDVTGRWVFRIDGAEISIGGCQMYSNSTCRAYQVKDTVSKTCVDVAPSFECPSLVGPTVVDREYIEFKCEVRTNTSRADEARFDIQFLFDGQPAAGVPDFIAIPPNSNGIARATLHERYLHGNLGKWVSCKAMSYWTTTANEKSVGLTSDNSYWAGIEVEGDFFGISEGAYEPVKLLLKSTLPITCVKNSYGFFENCTLNVELNSTGDIRLRKQGRNSCTYTFKEGQWKPDESKAYDIASAVDMLAKRDPFITSPRSNKLQSGFWTNLPDKVDNEQLPYTNMWNGYKMPAITVFHYDAAGPMCSSTGDPRIKTFDGLYYSTYELGKFIYTRSTAGLPFEVQVRHWPCSGPVACVCGVAVRENNTVLILDMCDGSTHQVSNLSPDEQQSEGFTIYKDPTGNTYKLQVPSGNYVQANLYSWGINLYVYIMGSMRNRTSGLCGSFDDNLSNDLTVKDSGQVVPPQNGMATSQVMNSWRLMDGMSLFEMYFDDLPTGSDNPSNDVSNYCDCSTRPADCGSQVVVENAGSPYSWEPQVAVSANILADNPASNTSDNVDWTYDSSVVANGSTFMRTRRTVPVEQSLATCQATLWDDWYLKDSCSPFVLISDVQTVINKCADDVQTSGGDLFWVSDKADEMAQVCMKAMTSFDTSQVAGNDTAAGIEFIKSNVNTFASQLCTPSNCNSNGQCNNGTCACYPDFIGESCSVLRTAVPDIVSVNGPADCDVRYRPCQSLLLNTANVANVPTLTCRVDVALVNGTHKVYNTQAVITSMTTTTCSLPEEALDFSFSNHIDFATALPPGAGDDFYSIAAGSPILQYSIQISNDGVTFGRGASLRVVDSLCMNCIQSSGNCEQKSDACLINGFCFAAGDTNPYRSYEYCDPSFSTTSFNATPDAVAPVIKPRPHVITDLNGTIYTTPYDISLDCAQVYSADFHNSLKDTVSRINSAITAGHLCTSITASAIAGDVRLGATGSKGQLTYSIYLFASDSTTIRGVEICAYDVRDFAANYANWRQPIIYGSGCPTVTFSPQRFDFVSADWSCL